MSEKILSLKNYEDVVGKKYIDQLKKLALLSKNKKVIMVNSTRSGGGVAEILHRLIPLLNELGINCRWKTIQGDADFFNVTKGFHNALQGTKINFSDDELKYYLKINEDNSKDLDLSADIVIIHDPQPLTLITHYPKRKGKWIWRCHIDMSKPDLALWKFLRKYLLMYDGSIFSISKFSRILPHPQYLIPPSIDPLSDKNKEIGKEEVDNILKKFNIKKDKPIILQVSRFDKFKDPIGVIKAYKLVKKEINCQLILAGGEATDDPEGIHVLEDVRKEAGEDSDIHILLLKPKSDIEINALQRTADVVVQKSVKEGFGLVVTEALWKEKPVIGGAAGGITIQIHNHHTGFLVHSIEGAAYRIRYLLNRPDMSKSMGREAKEFTAKNFLITRHIRDYLALFYILENPSQNIIYV